MSFVHLHVHTEYSLLDGLSRIPQLVARAKQFNMPALAITDHGVMYGAIEFYSACKDQGLKPIIGLEAYLAKGQMSERLPGEENKPYHLLLLAQNETGYKNLMKLSSRAMLDGFYYKPRLDHETLAAHSEGLIVTTGCLASAIPRLLTDERNPAKAKREIEWFLDVFGPERFYFELQDHQIPELYALNKQLLELQSHYQVGLVATNDVHYVAPEEAGPHDVLLCIGTATVVTEVERLKMSDASYYLRSPEEMQRLFGHLPGAIANTLKIAEMVELNLDRTGYHLPRFEVPAGHTPATYLRKLCEEGLARRYGSHAHEATIRARLEHELQVIHQMGFDAYFLIVWDLCRFAAERGIWYNVRGSGAGSIVSYASGITNLDPLKHGLIFERFLNPGRISMPDIDLDFPDDRRGEMIEYAVDKYGQDNVAQIITFGTLGAKAAIRDVARAMDIPLGEADRIAKLVPPGPKIKLKDALENPELSEQYSNVDYVHQLVDTAVQLEGVSRHASTHAAGVVIADQPLVEYTPLNRPTTTKGAAAEGGLGIVTQYPMETLEQIGLLKIDFLGLATLTIMREACQLIEQRHGIKYDLHTIPYLRAPEDPERDAQVKKLYDLLSSGYVDGVFQVESPGMRRVLTTMKPTQFDHIIATISLYRPGPMEYIDTYIRRMHKREPVTYRHAALEPILGETFAIIVYQEQIIRIAVELAGYAPGHADEIRRAVGKKKEKELLAHRENFVRGAVERGLPEQAAKDIYSDIEYFARYGFNKAHAADYAVITCQTAFLKAHYPVEYMAALLSVEKLNTDKVVRYIAECRRLGLEVRPPDANASEWDFSIESTEGQPPAAGDRLPATASQFVAGDQPEAIRFGLGAIKNVGEGPVRAILEARAAGQPFRDLDDFCRRVDLRRVQKRALECLIKVGALRAFGNRAQLLAAVDRILAVSAAHWRAKEIGQMSLFGEATGVRDTVALEPIQETSRNESLAWEKELVGLYVTDHPLSPVMAKLGAMVTAYSRELNEDHNGELNTLAGIVTHIRRHVTSKTQKAMAFVTLEDLQGTLDLVVFPKLWARVQDWLEVGQIVVVSGKVDAKGTEAKILVDEMRPHHTAFRPEPTARPQPEPGLVDGSELPPPDLWDAIPPGDINFDDQETPQADNANALAMTIPDHPPAPKPTGAPGRASLPATARAGDNEAPAGYTHYAMGDGRPRRLLVTVPPTGDMEKDKRRFRRVHGTLLKYPGQDQFALRVWERDHWWELSFPNSNTNYCSDLHVELVTVVGPEAINVEAL